MRRLGFVELRHVRSRLHEHANLLERGVHDGQLRRGLHELQRLLLRSHRTQEQLRYVRSRLPGRSGLFGEHVPLPHGNGVLQRRSLSGRLQRRSKLRRVRHALRDRRDVYERRLRLPEQRHGVLGHLLRHRERRGPLRQLHDDVQREQSVLVRWLRRSGERQLRRLDDRQNVRAKCRDHARKVLDQQQLVGRSEQQHGFRGTARASSNFQSIAQRCQQGDLVGWSTDWNWAGTGSVMTFASLVFGWQYDDFRIDNTGLPVQLSANRAVNCGWSFAVTGSGTMNVAYDMWLHTMNTPTYNSSPSEEIMVWLHRSGGAGPVGSRQTTVTIGGQSGISTGEPRCNRCTRTFARRTLPPRCSICRRSPPTS